MLKFTRAATLGLASLLCNTSSAYRKEEKEYTSDEEILLKEWETHMGDFVPEDMLNILLESRDQISIFTDIEVASTDVRAAYYVSGGTKKETVDIFVHDPYGDRIVAQRGKNQGIIRFSTAKYGPGTYEFVISNTRDRVDGKPITFALHSGQDDVHDEFGEHILKDSPEWQQHISESDPNKYAEIFGGGKVEEPYDELHSYADEEDLKSLNTIMGKSIKSVRKLVQETKMSLTRQTDRNQELQDGQYYNGLAMLVECTVFCSIVSVFLYHMKKTLDTKTLL